MAETDDLGLYAQWREGKSRSAFDELVERYAPTTKPEDLVKDIEALL